MRFHGYVQRQISIPILLVFAQLFAQHLFNSGKQNRFHYPVFGVLVFLPRKILDFWHFPPRSWQLFLARFAKFCKIFQYRGKESRNIFGDLGNKTKSIQDLGKRNKRILRQSNTRSVYILWTLILENSKNGLHLRVFLSEPQRGLTNKE